MQVCIHCGALGISPAWECEDCGWQATSASGVVILAPRMIADHDGFDEALFETYGAIERHHFWFAYRRKLIVGALKRNFPYMQAFLDIGCGTAETLNAVQESFPDARLAGGEPSLLALQMARHRTSASLLQMDARAMPFREAFDVVGAFDVIEHIDDDAGALAGMYRACKPGGGIVLTVPQHPWLWSQLDDASKHKRRYTRASLLTVVKEAGFQPMYVTSFISLLLPAMVASRLVKRPHATNQMDAGFRIGKLTNVAFGSVCEAERLLLRAGIRFPVGGSLLLVARKEG